MDSLRNNVISGTKWASLEKIAFHGIQFVLSIILARLLSPSDYGMIGMLGVFIAISQVFIDGGFSNALIRSQNRSQKDLSTVYYCNVVISIVCYVILFLIAPLVGDFYNIPLLCSLLRVQSLSLIFNSIIAVHITLLTIDINFKALAISTFCATIISGIVGIILAYLGIGVWALVAQNLISSIINVFSILLFCRWKPSFVFSRDSFKALFSFGSKLLLTNLINKVYANLKPIIIGRYFSSSELGIYSRGASFVEYPIYGINGILEKVTFPIFASIQDNQEKLLAIYRKYINIVSLVNVFVCMCLFALARPIVITLLTEKWESCIIFLQILCFSLMFEHICSINRNFLLVQGYSSVVLKLELIKKILLTLILFSSIPFGVVGIAVSAVVSTQIDVFLNTYYTGKLFKYGYIAQLKDYIPYLLYSLLACIPIYIMSYFELSNIVLLSLGFVVSSMLYWLVLKHNQYMIALVNLVNEKIWRRKNNRI